MNTYKISVYKFDELERSVQEQIADRERWNIMGEVMDCTGYDYKMVVEKIEEITHTKCNYEVDYCGYRCNVTADGFYDLPINYRDWDEIGGEVLFRLVDKIIMPKFTSGKTYYKGNKKRVSKILMDDDNYPNTGYCYENYFVYALKKYYNNWTKYPTTYSMKDLMNDCFTEIIMEWHHEYKYWADDMNARLIELSESSRYEDVLYFSDGTVCKVDEEYLEEIA